MALNFLQNEEKIEISGFDSTHIVDHNKKLILGLVWTLILHYSISMGWIQEKRVDGQEKEETPQEKLLAWIRKRLPSLSISNFTSDWNNGVALGALVNSMAPGALEDWKNWSPNEALENTVRSMLLAERLLNISPLVSPAEIIRPEIDELSVMTYLQQFPSLSSDKLNLVKRRPLGKEFYQNAYHQTYEGTQVNSSTLAGKSWVSLSPDDKCYWTEVADQAKEFDENWSCWNTPKSVDPTAIFASGDGLVKGTTGQKCEFVINTTYAGAGILTVQMDGPSKATLDAYELEKGYKVRYTPLAPGSYFASVKYNGIHAPGSPFKIPVEGKELGGNGYSETSYFKIDAVAKTSKGTVAVVPEYQGDASKVTVVGAGLKHYRPGRPATFHINSGLSGPNLLMVGVVSTEGPCEEVLVRHKGAGHYVVSYRIADRVKGFVFIKYGDKEIPGSPFTVMPSLQNHPMLFRTF